MRITNHQKTLLQDFKRYIIAKGYARGSDRRMAYALQEYFDFINKSEDQNLENITVQDIKNYRTYLEHRPNTRGGTLSPYTVTNYFYALKLFFDYAERIELIQINPMSALHYAQPRSEARQVLTKEEINMLYKACKNEQEKAILGLFYGCGLRRLEGEKLNSRDVDFKSAILYVRSGKGNKRRVLPMTETVTKDLKNYYYNLRSTQIGKLTRSDDLRAFMLNGNGTRMRGGSYYVYFKRVLQRTEITKQISLHHLRHSIATHLLAQGMKVETVRDFLGHTCLESTQIYTRVDKDQLR